MHSPLQYMVSFLYDRHYGEKILMRTKFEVTVFVWSKFQSYYSVYIFPILQAAVTLSKQQSGSTELSSIPMQRGSKEDILAAAGSPTGGTKSLGGSPRVAPARSLAGEKNPRPGSWNSHTKVSSSPILPSKYAMPASEKQT